MINSLLQKDKKCEVKLINSLEHLHVKIQESSVNNPNLQQVIRRRNLLHSITIVSKIQILTK